MNLPIQSQPVMRNVSTTKMTSSIEASGIACDICRAGCSNLSGITKILCEKACDSTVC